MHNAKTNDSKKLFLRATPGCLYSARKLNMLGEEVHWFILIKINFLKLCYDRLVVYIYHLQFIGCINLYSPIFSIVMITVGLGNFLVCNKRRAILHIIVFDYLVPCFTFFNKSNATLRQKRVKGVFFMVDNIFDFKYSLLQPLHTGKTTCQLLVRLRNTHWNRVKHKCTPPIKNTTRVWILSLTNETETSAN